MKCLNVIAIAVLIFAAACSTKQENVQRPPSDGSPPMGPPVGSWVLDAPNQPVK
jgi:hypothetical protein